MVKDKRFTVIHGWENFFFERPLKKMVAILLPYILHIQFEQS